MPVCGVDETTYTNNCEAWIQDAAINCVGQCPCAIDKPWLDYFCDPNAHCPTISSPVCGQDGQTYQNLCIALYKNCIPVKCMGTCPCSPDLCNPHSGCATVWDPVCGVDGMTYGNYCEAFAWGCAAIACEGWCPCGYGCLPSETCNDISFPVCGIDGVTYDNRCEAECAPVPIACESPCPCP